MTNRGLIDREVQEHFEAKWEGGDPWDLESSAFELAKYRRQLELLPGARRYPRALEIGCANGVFSRMLAPRTDRLVALDIAPSAIELARAAGNADGAIDFRLANVMDFQLRTEGPWDLVVFSETIPYLGWLYPLFDVGWLARELFGSMNLGGHLLMCNTCGGVRDYLLSSWLISTYRDLFRNVGFELAEEVVFRGSKHEVSIESLICLFRKEPTADRAQR